MENVKKIDQLRQILLEEDRVEINKLKKILEDKELLSHHISPIIEEHIIYLKNNYPAEFKKVVDKQIELKIKESQEEIISAIYPAVGTLISKYISFQFAEFRENIQIQIEQAKRKGVVGWVRRNILGREANDLDLAGSIRPTIEGFYVIEKNTGILLGSYSNTDTVDEDLLAGMLTAIRGFAEDAFMKGNQTIDNIEYDRLSIFIQSFPKYYIAIALNGKLTINDKNHLNEKLLTFVNNHLNQIIRADHSDSESKIRSLLEQHFFTLQD